MRGKIKKHNAITTREQDERQNTRKNNKAFLIGTIEQELEIANDEGVYKTKIKVIRRDDKYDHIPGIIPERLLFKQIYGKCVEIFGEFRSDIDNGRKNTYFYAEDIKVYDNEPQISSNNNNLLYLEGFLSDRPYCKTIQSEKQIAIFCVAIPREQRHEVDYIYCTAWEDDARWLKKQLIGEKVYLYGRMQSRTFYKKIEGIAEKQPVEVYEVNILEIDKLNN